MAANIQVKAPDFTSAKRFIDELGQHLEDFIDFSLSQQVDHTHVPQVTHIVLRMFLGHVLGWYRFLVEVVMAQGIRRQQYRAPARSVRWPCAWLYPGCPSLPVPLPCSEVIGRIIGGDADHRDIPLRADHVQGGDGTVVHAEIRVTHHLGRQPHARGLVTTGLGQFHIHFKFKFVTEQVGKNGIDGFAIQVPLPQGNDAPAGLSSEGECTSNTSGFNFSRLLRACS